MSHEKDCLMGEIRRLKVREDRLWDCLYELDGITGEQAVEFAQAVINRDLDALCAAVGIEVN